MGSHQRRCSAVMGTGTGLAHPAALEGTAASLHSPDASSEQRKQGLFPKACFQILLRAAKRALRWLRLAPLLRLHPAAPTGGEGVPLPRGQLRHRNTTTEASRKAGLKPGGVCAPLVLVIIALPRPLAPCCRGELVPGGAAVPHSTSPLLASRCHLLSSWKSDFCQTCPFAHFRAPANVDCCCFVGLSLIRCSSHQRTVPCVLSGPPSPCKMLQPC